MLAWLHYFDFTLDLTIAGAVEGLYRLVLRTDRTCHKHWLQKSYKNQRLRPFSNTLEALYLDTILISKGIVSSREPLSNILQVHVMKNLSDAQLYYLLIQEATCYFTCYLILATCHMLLASWFLQLVTCYWLFAICYLLLATGYLLFATCNLLLATGYLLFATCYLLLAACYLLLAAC